MLYWYMMIRDRAAWAEWENEYRRSTPPDFFRNLRIFEALYQEARMLGILPAKDPLVGMEHKIHLAKAINVLTGSRTHRPGS